MYHMYVYREEAKWREKQRISGKARNAARKQTHTTSHRQNVCKFIKQTLHSLLLSGMHLLFASVRLYVYYTYSLQKPPVRNYYILRSHPRKHHISQLDRFPSEKNLWIAPDAVPEYTKISQDIHHLISTWVADCDGRTWLDAAGTQRKPTTSNGITSFCFAALPMFFLQKYQK